MRRVHFNQSNSTICFRTWLLLQDTVDESDYKWLNAFDIKIRIDQPTHEFTTTSGGVHKIAGKLTITLDTTTDRQRDMLVLKYGNSVVLIQEEIVLPGSMSECVLDRIVWE